MSSTVTIDQTTKTTTKNPAKSAAVTALATVGFIALLIIGITLAIYAARYVPAAVSKLAGFTGNSNTPSSLNVVSSTTTIPFSDNGTILTQTTTTVPPTTLTNTSGYGSAPAVEPSTVPVTTSTYGNTSRAPAPTAHSHTPYGLSDLSVTIIATGYLASDSTDSFVPASIIPPGARPAAKFSIANKGTNVTGPWSFLAQIPTFNGSVFNSPVEPSLNPGNHTVFTLGFNQAIPGPAQTITIVADPNNNISESNEGNNSAAAAVTITATGN
jgi:hypothetical protein